MRCYLLVSSLAQILNFRNLYRHIYTPESLKPFAQLCLIEYMLLVFLPSGLIFHWPTVSLVSSSSYRPSSSLSSAKIDAEDQYTFKSLGLPRVKEVHHPNRVKDNVLHPAYDIAIPEVIKTQTSSKGEP